LQSEEIMERREFLAASLAASTVGMAGKLGAESAAPPARDYYQLRRYSLLSGPQQKLTENYFSDALIPALGRLGMGPVGALKLDIGPETPSYVLVVPSTNLVDLAELDLRIAKDPAAPFWDATNAAPAFIRVESWLLKSFDGWPRLTPPPSAAAKAKRIFQLRTYESPSNGEHVRKVEMFHAGEFDIFLKAGFHPVFFGDGLIGSRLPHLTYMLSFADMAELDAKWDVFRNDPAWKKLSADPRYAFDQIVNNITNVVLSPLACSQI
jgi:NIPSNAP protein